MKLTIEIEMDNAAFDGSPLAELQRILEAVPLKVLLLQKRPASLCDAPEALDKLMDINGNTVGSLRLDHD